MRLTFALAICLLPMLLHGQSGINTQLSWKTLKDWATPTANTSLMQFTSYPKPAFTGAFYPTPPPNDPPLSLNRLYAEQMPFFCRIEHQLGKKTNVPFKFRLGSVEYVDWMEGKSH